MASSNHPVSRRRVVRSGLALAGGLALRSRLAVARAWQTQPDAPSSEIADVGLDPGHSRVDVGASGAGVGEYQHTLDVAQRIRPLLEAAGLRATLSRADEAPVSAMNDPNAVERTRIEQTARIAAVGTVKIFVSIHFNGAATPALSGTETYYNGENAGPESRRLAAALQRRVVGALRDFGHPVVDRGVKEDLAAGKPYGHFFSLRGGMPSALVEAAFLSNPAEAALLLREDARQALAGGYAGGILEYFAGG
ncbi:MAG: N-acetylmuramoyl-L-alanine amidase [Chloroflexi bacterium]|nr:N-acetylmuramoyl-L-alanine amidase [Chloroflexota bacterium]